jgi:hypothetical protein
MTDTDWRAVSNFTHTCNICGATVTVTDGKQEPHRCRIEIPDRSE